MSQEVAILYGAVASTWFPAFFAFVLLVISMRLKTMGVEEDSADQSESDSEAESSPAASWSLHTNRAVLVIALVSCIGAHIAVFQGLAFVIVMLVLITWVPVISFSIFQRRLNAVMRAEMEQSA